jgi:hypothetical protein
MYDEGYLNAVSVGFQNLKARRVTDRAERIALGFKEDEEDALILEENELLELSAIPVPGNPQALMERMRAYSPTTARVFAGPHEDKAEWWHSKFEELNRALADEQTSTSTLPDTKTAQTPAELWRGSVALPVGSVEVVLTRTDGGFDKEIALALSERLRSLEAPVETKIELTESCIECELAESIGTRCEVHSPLPTETVTDVNEKFSELSARCERLEAEIKALRERPAGGVPSDTSPARSYLEEVLDEVEAYERLNGGLPRIK